jgi:hypothetical protein
MVKHAVIATFGAMSFVMSEIGPVRGPHPPG